MEFQRFGIQSLDVSLMVNESEQEEAVLLFSRTATADRE